MNYRICELFLNKTITEKKVTYSMILFVYCGKGKTIATGTDQQLPGLGVGQHKGVLGAGD